jgi:uncharacterized protein (TIGR02646 family)
MRRVVRLPLPPRVKSYLARKQEEINSGRDVQTIWETTRRTKTMGLVAVALAAMSGRRQRCMFCGDSRSTDIEHFWPKALYRRRVFRWSNLLWICTGCNRQKSNQFPLDRHGRPLLIDPTTDDPWDYLFFDRCTGYITARFDPASAQPHPKGVHTVDPAILPLSIEAVTEGRLRTQRNLMRAVRGFLSHMATSVKVQSLEAELLDAVRDNDDYGLALWYFRRDGATEEPFQTLRASYGEVWDRIVRAVCAGP